MLKDKALSDSGVDEDMEDNQKSRGQPWFERNPKKTLLLTLLILLLGATYAAEKILAHLNHRHNLVLFTERRYINLRECLPSIDVEEENRFPYLVGNLLEQMTDKKITSINGGVSGSNTLNSIDVLLNKVIPLKPNIVVMMENINDLICLAYDQTYWSRNPSRGAIVEFAFYKNLRGWRALTTLARDLYIPNLHVATRVLSKKIFGKVKDPDDEFAHVRGKKVELHQAQLIEEFTLNLQTFINICRARKITPVLMTQFSRVKADPDEKVRLALQRFAADTKIPMATFLDIYGKFNQAIVEVGRTNHILVIDLAREIPQEMRYMYDVVHLNAAGSRLAARVISEKLKPVVAP